MGVGGGSTVAVDLVGTYLDKFDVTNIPGGDTFDCAGKFGFSQCGTPLPKLRTKLRLSYTMENGLGLTGAWRFFSKVNNEQKTLDGGAPVCPPGPGDGSFGDQSSFGSADPLCINNDVSKINAQSYFDLALVARLGDNYTFRLGAQNILDNTPPVLDSNYTNNGSNTYAQVYDSLGRYIYAGIQLNF